ncbi:Branched-chain amino acid transport ATP-binding protein LivG (TC 3.A.1.4.1) [Patulibacter medicamentivorans]|uniref:Branched-chain amino acid transport ATP-binding protein LivG (TC 3.A.1.4.1) n=1 Tax=Patulibacter medicamentivorans TaxID=1097667 RepID=H0E6L7_9ACTN|nr:branched-chain amino acid ABC transporter permease/ATP-binding protein [Patulibacter medicamentivorans]EHN10664.1 Branched-chain amino acid transport ATP-binding protein LivG (TC 3.A.1.4.1) [Patulibacter medicamentivorans]
MSEHVQFLLLGLANGGVYAALALALVVTFRSSGVLNVATGALALLSAYFYAYLRQGELLLLLPGLPRSLDLGSEIGTWPAAILAVAGASLLGLVLYLLVFRPLRNALPVARTVASVGVMVLLTGLLVQRVGSTSVIVESVFPQDALDLGGGITVGADRVLFVAAIAAVAAALAAVYRFTRFGLATRAAAETERGAYVSGVSPDRIAALNWMISGAVAGVAGILIAPIVPLVPISYTLFVVPALAAALLARFQFLAVAVGAGVAIGMLQSEATFLSTTHDWLPSSGLAELISLVLILGALVLRSGGLPARGTVAKQSLGRAPMPRRPGLPALGALAVGAAAIVALQGDWRAGLVTSLIFGVITLSLVVVSGYAGQISLAQLTIAGVAGFLLGPLAGSWGIPFPLAPLLAAVGAGVLGVLVGLPALRTRGLSVAVVTLALAVAVEALWFRNSDLVEGGGVAIDPPSILGLDLAAGTGAAYPRLGFSLLALLVLAGVALGVTMLRRSVLGSRMLAVRANERSAAAAGVDVVRTKILAFGIAAFVAGIGGALYAYQLTNVTYDAFNVFTGLSLFATAYLAGITSVSGGILGGLLAANGIVFVALDRWVGLGSWFEVALGAALVLTVILNPEGVVGPVHARIARRRRRPAGLPGLPSRTLASSGRPEAAAAPRGPESARAATSASAIGGPALRVEGLTVRYGGVTAVDDVSFVVPRGRIVGLIGPNGAGKTTLIDAISGFVPADGTTTLGSRAMTNLAPHQRVRAGLGRTFQARELYDDLSVRENVRVAMSPTTGRAGVADAGDAVDAVLASVGLAAHSATPAGELSQGERQLVSIARSLLGRPDVLLLDEPAGGLDSEESAWLGERLRAVRDGGVSIVMVEHDMGLVLSLCDEIVVLNFGSVLAIGTPEEIRADRSVAAAYLGSTHAAATEELA